ncbi:7710_t:CDS:2 [Diversispora eburnea]|uniref:7710_t:CDS:1 n=1 Tax=Diversispora eburnea TaxID=1213867 RepID=A0A9N9FB09_9GLOM|nr:7710_t:CDS:2 [Diversispora eburnea]
MQNLNSNNKSITQVLGELSANIVFKMWNLKKCGSYRSAEPHFKKFCTEIISKSPISKTTVFLALKYVQMYIKKGNNTNFTNEYQLFTIALMLSNKWLNDKRYASKIWSEISYISQADIDTLEISFLKSLNFKMHITGEEYSFWLNCIKKYHLSDRLEYLFAERIGNMTTFQLTLPKPGFNYEQTIDSKVIESPAGFQYRLF